MKARTITALSLLAIAAAAAPAMAQGGGMGGPPNAGMMAQRTSDRMLQGITLSTAQADSVKAIDARYATDMTAIFQAGAGDRAAMREKMLPLRAKQRTDIRALLTADQQAVFDKNVADMEKARANRGAPGA